MPFIRGSLVSRKKPYLTIQSNNMQVKIPNSDVIRTLTPNTMNVVDATEGAMIDVEVTAGAMICVQININNLLNQTVFIAGHVLGSSNTLGVRAGNTLGNPPGRCDCFCIP